MGVDYQARKKAKKSRKHDALGTPRRVRKKNQARRLCRGPCYQEPRLQAEDLLDEPNVTQGLPSTSGELAAYASMTFGGQGRDKPAEEQATKQPSKKRKQPAQGSIPAADGAAPKNQKMSTDVRLLDVRTAKLAPARHEAPLASVSAPLEQFPVVVRRCMASLGFAEPTPIQSRCAFLMGCLSWRGPSLHPGACRPRPVVSAVAGPPCSLAKMSKRWLSQEVERRWGTSSLSWR